MKTTRLPIAPGLIRRCSQVIAIALGLSASVLDAAPVVTVNLADKEFGNGKEIHVTSGARLLSAATSYNYRVEGTVRGTGLLATLIPPGTSISDLIEQISEGGSEFLSGRKANPSGTLPISVINRTYAGSVSVPGFNANASVTIKGKVSAVGQVRFDVTNVSLSVTGLTITDTIVFETGSKLVVEVSPIIQFKKVASSVSETTEQVTLKVNRLVNASGQVTVAFATVPGTASLDDYEPTTGVLTFADGVTQQLIAVGIVDNEDNDGSRTFKVLLSAPTGGAILGVKKKNLVTILDDEL